MDKSTGKRQRVLISVCCITLLKMLKVHVQFPFKPFNKNTTKAIHINTVTTKEERKCLKARVKEMSD